MTATLTQLQCLVCLKPCGEADENTLTVYDSGRMDLQNRPFCGPFCQDEFYRRVGLTEAR